MDHSFQCDCALATAAVERAFYFEEIAMNGRPRTKAAKKRRVRIKKERREKKTLSRVMPMLSRRPKAEKE